MKQFIVAIFLCVAFTALLNAAQRKIAYDRRGKIFVADVDGTHSKKIAEGGWPEISPDGARVAFNTEGDAKNRPGPERHIAIADVASGKVTVLPNIPSDNCFRPVWSRDGNQIAFYIMSEGDWQIGVVKSNGSDFRFLKKAGPNNNSFWSMCWALQDHSFFCQDLTNLYQFAVDGSLIKRWDIGKLTGGGSMSSGTRLDVSPDGKRLLLSIDMGEESGRKDWDGPLPALWAFDVQSQKATRLTPKKLFGWDGVWLDNDNILFLSRAADEKEDSIYRMSTDGKNLKRLIKDARFPSVSGPNG